MLMTDLDTEVIVKQKLSLRNSTVRESDLCRE